MVTFGNLNLVQALVDAELRISILEKVVEQLINHQARFGQKPDIDLEAIRTQTLSHIQEKYPDLGIKMG